MTDPYAAAGVDISQGAKAKRKIAELARSASRPEVLSGVGFFGGLFEFKGYKNPVLVSSVDGVGTKIRIAIALDKHDTVGIDIVNHCINDIFAGGAEPLFFLDYIGMGALNPERVEKIVSGLAKACREAGCALIGGETAEMPGVYSINDYDLVGTIIGVVEKDKIIMGKDIVAGDVALGLPSSGLHTNGYSLARKVLGETKEKLNVRSTELGMTIGEALLEPHVSYYRTLKSQLSNIKGLAHITGGGMIGNIPRVLPQGLAASIDSKSWETLPIFKLIEKQGKIDHSEMFHIFNMGVGMVVFCAPGKAKEITAAVPQAKIIGEVVKQQGDARVIIDSIGYRMDKV
ncbi:MAG TPA: phosphoribosylformylglycinamidine cyclo-ligase [Dehalococcoidales bacterium]|nr:phosphoribosylformylglycinamidine cyclo-ligase [Dehalococcoidales bacterium]